MNRELSQFLAYNCIHQLATVDKDGHPRVRPFIMLAELDGKLYYVTSKDKAVYMELQADPRVEICVLSPVHKWARISGKAVFVHDEELKKKVIAMGDIMDNFYKTTPQSNIAVFYLEGGKACLSDLNGGEPVFCDL